MLSYSAVAVENLGLLQRLCPFHAPGVIVTERVGSQAFIEAASTAHEIARTPLQRLGLPADVGKVAVFLACDDLSYINGTTIVLDGGVMAVW